MKKYLVDVYLPAINKHYDVYLPANKPIGEATTLLVKLAESLSDGKFKGTSDAVLLNSNDGKIINRDLNVFDAGIRNASMLILV